MGDLSTAVAASQQDSSNRLEIATRELRELHAKFDAAAAKRSTDVQTLDSMSNIAKGVADHCLWRKRIEDILRSLHFNQIATRKSAIKKAHADTFAWSLNEERTPLAKWLASGSGVFWVEGKAGSGKSTLMKYLERQAETRVLLEKWAAGGPLIVATHYFWSSGITLQRSLLGLYRTLLFHLLVSQPDQVTKICPERLDVNAYHFLQPWTLEELQECFDRLVTYGSSTKVETKFCFFIDGLDEFRGENDTYTESPRDLIKFIQTLSRCDNIKVCASSRPWTEFKYAFRQTSRLRVEDLTAEDIRIYVEDELSSSPRYLELRSSQPLEADDFVTELRSHADGVFLWVYYVVRNLLQGLSKRDSIAILKQRLREFPDELEDYFAKMLQSIDKVYRTEVGEILQMLVSAQFPITVAHILMHRAVCTVKQGRDRLFSETQQGTSPEFDDEFKEMRDVMPQPWLVGQIDWKEVYEITTESRPGKQCRFDASRRDNIYKKEADLLTARCGDLVHVWYPDEDDDHLLTGERSRAGFFGFMHRSVADFLTLPQTAAIIGSWVSGSFHPVISMIFIHLGLHYGEIVHQVVFRAPTLAGLPLPRVGQEKRPVNLLRALYLAGQAEIHGETEMPWYICREASNMIEPLLGNHKWTNGIEGSDSTPPDVDLQDYKRQYVEASIFPLFGYIPPFLENLMMATDKVHQLNPDYVTTWDKTTQSYSIWTVFNMLHHAHRVALSESGEAEVIRAPSINLEEWSTPAKQRLLKEFLADDSLKGLFMLVVARAYKNKRKSLAKGETSEKTSEILSKLIGLGAPRYIEYEDHETALMLDQAMEPNTVGLMKLLFGLERMPIFYSPPKSSTSALNDRVPSRHKQNKQKIINRIDMARVLEQVVAPPWNVNTWQEVYDLQKPDSLTKTGFFTTWYHVVFGW